jgi:hypothetical protein
MGGVLIHPLRVLLRALFWSMKQSLCPHDNESYEMENYQANELTNSTATPYSKVTSCCDLVLGR